MNELFVIPAISVTVSGLLSPWTGLVLVIFWVFSLYRVNKKTDYDLDEALHLVLGILIVVDLILFGICTEKEIKVTRLEAFFLGVFLALFPVWFFVHACLNIWPLG